jgi:hypothetical protein
MMKLDDDKRPAMRWLVGAALLAALASAAAADEAALQAWPAAGEGGKTRAEVRAELVQARANGSMRVMSSSYNPLAESRSLKSAAQVRDELLAARASGEMAATLAEPHAFALEASTPTRVAETSAAR